MSSYFDADRQTRGKMAPSTLIARIECPVLGVKGTLRGFAEMSLIDPLRTSVTATVFLLGDAR